MLITFILQGEKLPLNMWSSGLLFPRALESLIAVFKMTRNCCTAWLRYLSTAMLSRTNRVSPFGLSRRLALSARCCFLTSAVMLHTRESISTNLPTPAPSAGPSAGRCTSRPTSPRTVCTTHGELVFGQYVVHFCASCSLVTALRFEGPVHTPSSQGCLVILQLRSSGNLAHL